VELIIPSYNRLPMLRESISRIRVLYPQIRICVGLQGEKPDADFQAQLDHDRLIRIEHSSVPSTTRALNYCIRTSDADIILILDDDAVPCFGWAESHIAAFRADPGLSYTCGREIRSTRGRSALSEGIRILTESFFGLFLKKDKKINGRIVGWINNLGLMFGNFDQPGTCAINTPRGCNMTIRKEPFIALNGFNENFKGNAWGFETDFGLRAARIHKLGRYVGDAVVIHHEALGGGSREHGRSQWFRDYVYNHKVLISNLGPQAWLGSLPRLIKKRFFK
jgi:GT2 family glycosyltransferase